jgi:hypothetical protein
MVIQKLKDYDHANDVLPLARFEGYGVKARMDAGYDFLGRELNYQGQPYRFEIDDSQLPEYLLKNREKWKHLLK